MRAGWTCRSSKRWANVGSSGEGSLRLRCGRGSLRIDWASASRCHNVISQRMRSQPVTIETPGGRGPTVGIVGAGRSRQGLGPFLAQWLAKAGACVVGVSGRDLGRTAEVAVALTKQLGHQVAPYGNAAALARDVDALVVACPVAGHLEGLDAALAAGIPCLCEKPLVSTSDAELGLQRVKEFADRQLLLVENCQWPYVLAAVDGLSPGLRQQRVRSLVMRLSPAWPGRSMIEDSLSHVLSLLQALVPLPAHAELRSVRQSNPAADARDNVVHFEVLGGIDPVAVELHLQCCPQQPRPAWFAVNGVRFERQLGPDYAISFATEDGRVVNVQDPLDRLVYGFVENLKVKPSERTIALDAIALRIRLYTGVLAQL